MMKELANITTFLAATNSATKRKWNRTVMPWQGLKIMCCAANMCSLSPLWHQTEAKQAVCQMTGKQDAAWPAQVINMTDD